MKKLLVALASLLAAAVPAFASDHMNLEENLPTELEDAYPIKHRDREIQGIIRCMDEGKDVSRMVYQPVVELGILPNTQRNIAGTFYSGNADHTGSGDVSAATCSGASSVSACAPARTPALCSIMCGSRTLKNIKTPISWKPASAGS